MADITIKLYHESADIKSLAAGTDTLISEDKMVLEDFGLKRYNLGSLKVHAFDDHLTPNAPMVLATMFIPGFFDQVPRDGTDNISDIHGNFLFKLGATVAEGKAFVADKGHGSFGCPTRLLFSAEFDCFSFNRMRFYPFIMPDYSIGYYVCDGTASEPIKWPAYDPQEVGVALHYPLTYDATLGIYLTRGAHIVKP